MMTKRPFFNWLVVACCLLFSGALLAQPANDECANAEVLPLDGTVVAGTSVDATANGDDTGCTVGPGVWYTFTGTGNPVQIDASPEAGYDIEIAVASGSCAALTNEVCRDFSVGDESVTINTLAGVDVYVYIGDFSPTSTDVGTFDISALEFLPPANDLCADAIELMDGDTLAGNTVAASNTGQVSCDLDNSDGVGVWYTFMGNGMVATVSTSQDGTDFDTQLTILEGDCDNLTCVTQDDDAGDGLTSVVVFTTMGQPYYVYLDGFGGNTGNYEVSLDFSSALPNDLCEDAEPLTAGVNVIATNDGATGDGAAECDGAADGDFGVWYSFTGTGEVAVLSTVNPGTDFDTQLAAYIFTGSCAELTCAGGNDDSQGTLQSTVITTTEDAEYIVYVDGFGSNVGQFELSFELIPIPANDTCINAEPLTPTASITASNIAASDVGAVTCGGLTVEGGRGLWYSFVGAAEPVTVSTSNAGTDFDTQIIIYTGDCDGLQCVADDDDSGDGLSSEVTFFADANKTYYVYVDGFGAAFGNFELSLDGKVGPVDFTIQASAITNVNVTLNENCEAMLVPRQVLAGNFDVDGDGNEPPANQFEIIVQDENPDNGPIIDGCGEYIYTISVIDEEPDTTFGFNEDFDVFGPNWGFFFTPGFDPATGQDFFITISLDNEELTLGTVGSPDFSGALFQTFGELTFTEAGQFSFDYDYNGIDAPFDVAFVNFDNEVLMTTETIFATTDPDSGRVNLPVNPGDRLVFVMQDDGVGLGLPASTFAISGIEFVRDVFQSEVEGFTTAWGYVNAEDKTSPTFPNGTPTAPAELFCSELEDVNINELAANISRCWMADGTSSATINSSMDPRLRAKLLAGGGVPVIFDGCSDVEICVNDIVQAGDACDDVVITRVFTARDGFSCTSIASEANAPTVAQYDITFTRPDLDDVAGVPDEVRFECEDFGPADPNPAPEADDFPFLLRANGSREFLGTSFCNIGATFEDGPRIETCANTYKFVRTFTVIDWCDVTDVRTFSQVVKVGDFVAPTITAPTQDLNFDGVPDSGPLFFSTNSLDCTAFVDLLGGVGVDDNCDANPTVVALVFPFGDLTGAPLGPFDGSALAGGFPRGTHTIRYIATDNCDNSAELEVQVTIDDRTAPVAICEDGLNISVGGNGTVELCADDVDRASYDDCSDITRGIARVDGDNNNLAPYAECITLDCSDLGTVAVGLEVIDAAGNANFCWLDVLVEDKASPICIAPSPVTVTCQDLEGGFPDDLDASGLTSDEIDALLDTQFGVANGVDNCPTVSIDQSYVDNRSDCGTGTITRSFVVTDGVGLTSPANACRQIITILGVHDYTVVFPGDRESDECVEPDYNDVTFEERGCDLITVATDIDTFTATADECYKLRVTYEVLNWCEYNTEDDAYRIPRDADNDNNLVEDTYLHVVPNNLSGIADDLAFLDRDDNRTNATTIANLDTGDGGILPGTDAAGYGQDGSRGAFIYQQFIKVYDDTAPTLTVDTPDGGFCDLDGDCQAPVELTYSIDDDCSPESVSSTVELDAFIDAGADGIYTLADFVADGPQSALSVTNVGGDFTITTSDLPLGMHAVRIVATDGCGNTSVDIIEFEIIDCKAPTPICINGLTATLMPDGNGGGMAAIWAIDFIASPSTDCAGEVKFSIYTVAEASVPGFEPAVGRTGIDMTCDDLGMLPVRIYAIDPNGQSDFCETTVFVQAFADGVCTGSAVGSIAGTISTPGNDMMTGVTVNITDDASMNTSVSTDAGLYQFEDLELGQDFTIEPAFDPSVNLADVSTGDLIILSRHILGLEELENQFQHLAGDVNQDGIINVLDIIAIRRVILGLDATFQNTPSWRFYTAEMQEVFNVNNLEGNMLSGDFTAIQMGDLNGAAEARTAFGLNVDELELKAGNTYEVAFTASDLAGFQATIELATGVELADIVYGNVEAGNFNLDNAASGLIAVSYNGEAGELFTLRLHATTDGQLSDYLKVSDRITYTQGYNTAGEAGSLNINFGVGTAVEASFELGQNTPNPFAAETQISFTLPKAGEVSLTVQDVQGRTIMVRSIEGFAGVNVATLTTAELKGATGVLSYTIVAGDHTATRKMVVVQ